LLKALKRALHPAVNVLDGSGFAPVLDRISIVGMDIGARGDIMPDLLPMARCVTAIGFEPDPQEIVRLNEQAAAESPWKKLLYLPYALGEQHGTKPLHIYSAAGCSSLLPARRDIGVLFSRGDYYDLVKTVDITVAPLDSVVETEKLPFPDHIKVDVQGAEKDVFAGARASLESALAVRTEVSFFPLYEGQPLFADIDSDLRGRGFVMMGFLESHDWRRRTKIKYPRQAPGPVPFSRGQLIHGDALYMRAPEDLADRSDTDRVRRTKLGLIAACYQFIDHAHAALGGAAMQAFGREAYGVDFSESLSRFSRHLGRWPAPLRSRRFPAR
jgi:FkbM family methyltransferase